MAEGSPSDAVDAGDAAKAVPVPKSGGGFKLRLKLNQQPPPPPEHKTSEEDEDEDDEGEDEEEDQLASSSSGSSDEGDQASSVSGVSVPQPARGPAHPSPSRSLLATHTSHPADEDLEYDDDDVSRLSSVPPSDEGDSSRRASLLAPPAPPSEDVGSVSVNDHPTSDVDMTIDPDQDQDQVHPAELAPVASTSAKPSSLAKKRKKPAGTGRGKGWRSGQGAAAQMPSHPPDEFTMPPAKKGRGKGKRSARASAASAQMTQFGFDDPGAAAALYVPPPPRERIAHDPALGPPVPPPVSGARPFPLGPLPKAQSGFLPALPLERKAPRTRAWKKVLREVVTVGGYPCRMWTFAGDAHSDYALAKQAQLAAQAGIPTSGPAPLYLQPFSAPPPGSVPYANVNPYDPSSMAPPPAPGSTAPPPLVPLPHPPHHAEYLASNPALGGPPLPASFRMATAQVGEASGVTPEKPKKGKGKGRKSAAAAETVAAAAQEQSVAPQGGVNSAMASPASSAVP